MLSLLYYNALIALVQCFRCFNTMLSLLYSLMISGYKKPVTEGEIFQLNPREQSKTVIPRFEANWNKEKEKYRTVR